MSATLTSAFWYLSRGTGVVTLVLLTLVSALGIITRSGRPLPGLPRFAVAAVHRSSSLLMLVFLGIHVVALLLDKYAQLRLLDLVLPFAGAYRPLWLGLGTLAGDLLIALVVTSLLRYRLGPKIWRAIHWTAYATWPIAILHAMGTGTDSGQLWLRATAALSTITLAAVLAWRCSDSFAPWRSAGLRLPRTTRTRSTRTRTTRTRTTANSPAIAAAAAQSNALTGKAHPHQEVPW
jgi:sulfoxide reductase heme-binding subunit YedZ